MIAFEVYLNGQKLCTAGREDLSVLSASISASGKLGEKPSQKILPESLLWLAAGGLTSKLDGNPDTFPSWLPPTRISLKDTIRIKVVETDKVDPALIEEPKEGP